MSESNVYSDNIINFGQVPKSPMWIVWVKCHSYGGPGSTWMMPTGDSNIIIPSIHICNILAVLRFLQNLMEIWVYACFWPTKRKVYIILCIFPIQYYSIHNVWVWLVSITLYFYRPDGSVDLKVDMPLFPRTWTVGAFSLSMEDGLAFTEIPNRVKYQSPSQSKHFWEISYGFQN